MKRKRTVLTVTGVVTLACVSLVITFGPMLRNPPEDLACALWRDHPTWRRPIDSTCIGKEAPQAHSTIVAKLRRLTGLGYDD